MKRFIFLLITSCCAVASAQNTPTLTIASPSSGLVVQPGQNLTVTVSGTNQPANGNEGLVITDPIGWPAVQNASTDNQFTVTIPASIDPGSYSITAVESSASTGLIVSSPIVVTVSPTYSFDSLAADVNTVLFSSAGETCPLVIQGTTAGVSKPVSNQFLTFASANPAIATVDSNGIVTPQSTGTTTVSFSYGNVKGSVTVLVGTAITAATQTAAPTFTPVSGSFTSSQNVILLDATAGAVIYYTLNGTTPSTSSTVYTSPITISSSANIEAIAIAPGYTSSTVSSASYVIQPTAAAPSFSPAGGTYSGVQTVAISDATTGAAIYYTTNGVTPSATSTLYTTPITVSTSQTIQAIAVASGYANSSVASSAYVINLPAASTPSFSPAAGVYTGTQSVVIADSTPGVSIYYTTNGSAPSVSSIRYTGPISVSSSETIQASAIGTGYASSAVAVAAYTINAPVAATPTFSPSAGTYQSTQTVTIGDATPGATIYYTRDGTTPTTSSTVYAGAISIATSATVQAIAVVSGYTQSPVATAIYTISSPQDFTVGLSTTEMTVSSSQPGTSTVTITPQTVFSQPITFSCSGLPASLGLSCTFSPSTLTPDGVVATSTLTVRESGSASLFQKASPVQYAGLLAIVVCSLFGPPKRSAWRPKLLIVFLAAFVVSLSLGCGSARSATVTVTASSGSLVHSSTFTLTIR